MNSTRSALVVIRTSSKFLSPGKNELLPKWMLPTCPAMYIQSPSNLRASKWDYCQNGLSEFCLLQFCWIADWIPISQLFLNPPKIRLDCQTFAIGFLFTVWRSKLHTMHGDLPVVNSQPLGQTWYLLTISVLAIVWKILFAISVFFSSNW